MPYHIRTLKSVDGDCQFLLGDKVKKFTAAFLKAYLPKLIRLPTMHISSGQISGSNVNHIFTSKDMYIGSRRVANHSFRQLLGNMVPRSAVRSQTDKPKVLILMSIGKVLVCRCS